MLHQTPYLFLHSYLDFLFFFKEFDKEKIDEGCKGFYQLDLHVLQSFLILLSLKSSWEKNNDNDDACVPYDNY